MKVKLQLGRWWTKARDVSIGLAGFLGLIALLLMAGLVGALFVYGGAWISTLVLPWFSRITWIGLALTLLVLLPLGVSRATRGFSSTSLLLASYLFGTTLWMDALLVTVATWGYIAAFIGIFIAGIGVVPIAMLAALTNGLWSTLVELLALTIMTYASRVGAIRLQESLDSVPSYDLSERIDQSVYPNQETASAPPRLVSLDDPVSSRPPSANADRRLSYVKRHWRGDLPLWISYWISGFAVTIGITVASAFVPLSDILHYSRTLYSGLIIASWALLTLITVWQLVGIWRSATVYAQNSESPAWASLAKIAVVFGAVGACTTVVFSGLPQIAEYVKIASGNDPIGTYQLRVIRDATELEIAGAITFGLTDEVRRVLEAHPSVRIIHLNSDGGRVDEARRLRDLIDTRGLSTFTASGCFSACTVAYAGGRERLIGEDASLGFHQYSFPGLTQDDFAHEYENDKKDWLARGFAKDFVERAFLTPPDDLWKPDHSLLLDAGVITGYPKANDVALTGFTLGSLRTLEQDLTKHPLFEVIKTYEPEVYEKLVLELRSGLERGRSRVELHQTIFPIAQAVYTRKLPYASNEALRNFVRLLLDQASILYTVDPDICYDYLNDETGDAASKAAVYFPQDLREREFEVMAEVIRSAATRRNETAKVRADEELDTVFRDLHDQFGDDLQTIIDPAVGASNKAKACEITYGLYEKILHLPEDASGAVLRFMFTGDE